ncbi:MAG: hypothetical protein NXH75_06175 [Halobacteriovoraceae bacterium]|nr:hypothetical protein [Halobacteriovoraceae bacterium]
MKTILAVIFISIRIVHTYFSIYLCLGHPFYRPIAKKQKIRFYGIPLLIVLPLLLFFIAPESVIPWETKKRLGLYSLLVFPLTYWHYASQHYGVLSIYRNRAKQFLNSRDIFIEKFFCHSVTAFFISFLTLNLFYDVGFLTFSLKSSLFVDSIPWKSVTHFYVWPFTFYMIYKELNYQSPSYHKLLYFFSMGLMTLIVTVDSFYISWMLIDLQHFLVVFGLGGHMLSKTVEQKKVQKVSLWKPFIFLILISIALSVFYFYVGAHGTTQKNYQLILSWLPQRQKDFFQLFFYGFFIANGIVHYYYDRLAFRFSDPEIGKVAKSLI